ncbi:tetratricopeptide repeat protein [Acetobacter papayae]|uniref:tetratricopeptide repeat protein n=1 Tax=Acetobacter papayae TaxID=1076592 RepID=UPI00227737CD|nr:tetratricopeptide repeat protein [Acetobacter papayae]
MEHARQQVEDLVGQNRIDEAIACYRAVLVRHPNLGAVHAAIGALLRKQGHHQQALRALEQAHSLMPHEPSLNTCLAVVLQEMGRIDEATAQFRQAIALAPDEPSHYLGLVRLQSLTLMIRLWRPCASLPHRNPASTRHGRPACISHSARP